MAPKDVHASVVKRKRLTLATDVGIAIVLLAAVLQLFNPTVSTALWLGGGALAAVGLLLLRKSIGGPTCRAPSSTSMKPSGTSRPATRD
ncbi:hypothetical protein CKJ85_03910 [Corynebacterium sp. NML 150383]|uniref:hypothetical protein n=1 Tax=Corynebacterium TaxID=1716 RepID=UPI000BAA871C|nr:MULTISPECIES: hypothetical protein [Corynebacterium]MCG7254577.1 hypothetical protein [Corynebacterium hadale]MCG7256172.1 hypothetical protein [Corynebacterium hadale]MCG7264944.1 hypothetical protein [Corynebacterium hadale]PAT03957.1 hypothetical protein CKJ85_03910 [Corynebacterium sp. NML 150383]